MFFHVSPPSVDFHKAEPSPPLSRLYGVLLIFQVDAYIILGLLLSILISTAPDLWFAYKTFFHELPPFVDLYSPLSGESLNKSPITAMKTILGSVG